MSQKFIPCVFYRGGTSKGIFFHPHHLPSKREEIDKILLAAIGSPDPYERQLNGMGGGLSSLSKAVIIGKSTHPDCDVDYTFIQLDVTQAVADWSNNCGNLSSAVGHFAVDEGLVKVEDGEAHIRIHQTNTSKIIHSRFQVKNGKAVTQGDYVIAGVAGSGARIRLDFLDPAGAKTGKLLPSNNAVDWLEVEGKVYEATLIDAASPIIYIEAQSVGLKGSESPNEIEATAGVLALLEKIRRIGGVKMGLASTPVKIGLQTPRIALVARPQDFKSLDGEIILAQDFDIATRMFSMGRAHRAIPGTGGISLGVATQTQGTLPHRLSKPANEWGEVRVANPSGLVSVGADIQKGEVKSGILFRTARRLMQGEVGVPETFIRSLT